MVVVAIVWAPVWVYLVVLGTVLLAAADEMVRMARAGEVRVGRRLPSCLLALVLGIAAIGSPPATAMTLAAVVLVLPVARLADPRGPDGSLAGVAVETTIVGYLGITGASMMWLRTMPASDAFGIQIVLFLLIAVWVGDSGAYYLGKTFGRHPMAPSISPKKTWEGLMGGVAATAAGTAAFHAVWPLPMTWLQVAALAGVLAVVAPLGDLIESQFKRDTGIKDSSRLIPGHGGILDRTDSLLYVAPFVLAVLWLLKVVP